MTAGCKVVVSGYEEAGIGEVVSLNSSKADVRFYTNGVSFTSITAPSSRVRRVILPAQTRCFQRSDDSTRYGRVIACQTEASPLATYLVQSAGEKKLLALREDEFSVRSYLSSDDSIEVLASLANETPFFFEQRFALLEQLLTQARLCRGLPALLSSKVEILQHQVEIAARVLLDPTMRYLLADEVGLGKTIEAGIILRQVSLDAPGRKIGVTVPAALVYQWRTELSMRFDLTEVEVFAHEELISKQRDWDVLVIDEAHRLVRRGSEPESELVRAARIAAEHACHLLLLSATPVLHHDLDLLALLEMLDPQNYSRRDLASFQERTARRRELGRALLALRNATIPALINRSAAALAEMLPEDATVQTLVTETITPGADLRTLQRVLHLHLSETYRIHRRMLRTRRRWLADAEARFHRNIEESVEYEVDEERHMLLWNTLEEWRTECVARVQANTDLHAAATDCYIKLAEAIAGQPDILATLVSTIVNRTEAPEAERTLLQRIVSACDSVELIDARIDLITEVLRSRLQRDGKNSKFVVFCPSSNICRRLAKRLQSGIPAREICTADLSLASGEAAAIFASFATNTTRVLITDSVGEEGFNLQFARAVLFYDLPWSPMRLEQRLGRLDRIDRGMRITCIPVATAEDDSLALDEAWRRIVSEGLGLYAASISDLQHLVDRIMPRLRDRAFVGGPTALVEELSAVADTVSKEREAIEEQDVIDGVHGLSSDCPRQIDLVAADEAADRLGATLTNYLKENIGIKQWWDEEDNSFTFRLPHDSQPLVPVDRLRSIAALFNAPFTVHRSVAIEDFSLQFLRPGHPAVDGCRELLDWDDRGRAFAMWRQAPGLQSVRVIFRCVVHAGMDLRAVEAWLEKSAWDEIRRGALLRMVRGWFAEFLAEIFLDEKGEPAAAAMIETCRRPYSKFDVNLGKERAEYIRSTFGAKTWQEMSQSAGQRAIEVVRSGEMLASTREAGQSLAAEHFAVMRARLTARAHAGIESATAVTAAEAEEKVAHSLIEQMLAQPTLRMDAIGAYFLSEKPFWEEKE